MSKRPDVAYLHHLADLADAETLPRFRRGLSVAAKDKPGWSFDPVTEADEAAERALRAAIARDFPDHAILGEETGETGYGPYRWVLDPVDGTRPYVCGLPVWATLIGLEVNGRTVMGMMSQPFTGERFWADTDGAWASHQGRRRRLRTRNVGKLSKAILHTTSPEGYGALGSKLDSLTAAVQMVRFGGEAYAVAMLADGHIDLCLEPSLQPYDIVALVPIIERAGGVVTRLDGARPEAGGPVLAAASGELHEKAMALLG